ncbi:MoaD/ThiS family protein [Roseiconus sp. JC912]|uniref:MoaD/ThiS family protein n=1 Tax=Roseiconus sp. JC912 TaxID=3396307 RepID=UPI003A4C5507
MKVLLISNDAGGFAEHVELSASTTVKQLFERHIGAFNPNNYLIRVNRQPATSDQLLCDGDRVSFTPLKIEGAHR